MNTPIYCRDLGRADKEMLKDWVERNFDTIEPGEWDALLEKYGDEAEIIACPGYGTDQGKIYGEGMDSEECTLTPMWAYKWRPKDKLLTGWILEHAAKIADEAGFTVYKLPSGVYLGVNGAGYDFYSTHWCRLFNLYRFGRT